ncbi:MAG: penicillin-binding protein 1C [Roseinatronobacter sp.]
MKWGATLAALAMVVWIVVNDWIARTDLPSLSPKTGTEVLAEDGQLLRAYMVTDGRWRLAVDPSRVDATYLAMLFAFEDRRFYHHAGVDPLALGRAALQAFGTGRIVSGGSTLTMQVARLVEDGPTGTWAGKLRQIRVALALERRLSKAQILSLYLHHAPMGGNLEGLRAGALAWFGREPERLTVAQAALLIALPQAPGLRSPDRHPDRARAARDRVLARASLAGVIDADTAHSARTEPVPTRRRPFPQDAPHLADRLRAADPENPIHRTTIRADLQRALQTRAIQAVRPLPAQASVAIVVAELQTGAIRASVGSSDYTSEARLGFVDMTQALRSPGSTLKPLIYGMAMSDGMALPETLLNDRPTTFGGYAPQNFDRMFRGQVTLREALQVSLNLPVVELTQVLGPARVLGALRAAGLSVALPGDTPGLAIALGGLGVSLEGLTQLYGAIARGGQAVRLSATAPDLSARMALMRPEAAWHLGAILSDAPRPGHLPATREIAFKTGTSYGHRDALAIGYDGAHVVGVWVGRADGAPVPGTFGVDVAAPILFQVFGHLAPRPVPLPPPPPGTLILSAAELPPNLRFYGQRLTAPDDSPQLAFPPDGALLAPLAGGVLARVERGRAPFTWFANGAPILAATREREARLPLSGPGFVALSVIDAEGRASSAQIELR